jgi:D-arabinose 5-phosphate isomerase GutQ
VFDEINPPFGKNDLFTAISQSGETSTILALAQKAKNLGGAVLGVTSNNSSTLAELSDNLLVLQKLDERTDIAALRFLGTGENQNVLGAVFGFNLYILFYTLVAMIAETRGESAESINARHANLQ